MRILALAVVVASSPAHAQEARLVASDPPAAELRQEFTRVTQVRELRDGRVVVLDRDEAVVVLADYRTSQVNQLGRHGEGPGEYRSPLWMLPLGGDSVGVFDDASLRVLVIDAQGQLSGFLPAMSPSPGTGTVGALAGDGRGAFYGEGSATAIGPDGRFQRADSAPLFRWAIGGSDIELVGHVPRPPPSGAVVGPGVMRPGTALRPGTRDMWAVGSDARIAIVHHDPYRVDFLLPSGTRRAGATMPFTRVSVNDSVKQAVLSERSGVPTATVVDGRGVTSTVRRRPPAVSPASINWASEVPPFRGDTFVAFAPDGALWIQRTTFGREGARYDLVGADGRLVDRIRLPEGHRVAGFGRGVMYVVRRDSDDIEYVQRRPLPRR